MLASVNYFGTVEVMEGLRPALARGDRPSAVAISSNSTTTAPGYSLELVEALLAGDEAEARRVADEVAGESMLEYAATKLAVAYWVRQNAVGEQWGRAGIRLNAIAPGMIATPMIEEGRSDATVAPQLDMFEQTIALGRPGRPEEMAALLGVPRRHRVHLLLRLDRLLRRRNRRPVPGPRLPEPLEPAGLSPHPRSPLITADPTRPRSTTTGASSRPGQDPPKIRRMSARKALGSAAFFADVASSRAVA